MVRKIPDRKNRKRGPAMDVTVHKSPADFFSALEAAQADGDLIAFGTMDSLEDFLASAGELRRRDQLPM